MEHREQLEVIATATSLTSSWRKAQAYKAVEFSAAQSASTSSSTSNAISRCAEVLVVGRQHGWTHSSSITTELHSIGERSLANRVRAIQCVRGAHAHPDVSLAKDVEEVLRQADFAAPRDACWNPSQLLRRQAPSTASRLRRRTATDHGGPSGTVRLVRSHLQRSKRRTHTTLRSKTIRSLHGWPRWSARWTS